MSCSITDIWCPPKNPWNCQSYDNVSCVNTADLSVDVGYHVYKNVADIYVQQDGGRLHKCWHNGVEFFIKTQ